MFQNYVKRFICYSLLCHGLTCGAQSVQESKELDSLKPYRHINFSLDVKNMHLWRGFQVTSGAMTGASLYYITPSKNFKTGFWGGAGFDGTYKEVCFYINYQHKNFFADLLNSFNSTGYDSPNIFSYNRRTSPHFVDIALGYNFLNTNLRASLATMVLGRDVYIRADGSAENRFSHYAELKYTAWSIKDSNLKIFVGGSFSFISRSTFYSTKPNLVNIGVELNRTLSIFSYELPLSATFRINPEQKNGALQFAAHLF
jgi:hypothetical protein